MYTSQNKATINRKRRVLKENISGYFFIAPTMLFYTVFTAGPIVFTIFVLSFSDFSLIDPIRFIGLTNFRRLFTDPDFFTVMLNTLKFISIIAPLHIIGGLVLAVLIDAVGNRFFQGFFRTVFYFPLVVTTASVAIVFGYLYDVEFGILNWILTELGFQRIRWLGDTRWSLLSVALFSAWKFIGNAFLYYYIGLRNVPDSYVEAAKVDGANWFQTFFRVRLPLLTPVMFFVVVTTLINCFQMFDEPYFLTRGGPGVSSQTIAMHIYRRGFSEFHFGYASTLGLILFVMVLIVTIVMFSFQKKWVHYDYE